MRIRRCGREPGAAWASRTCVFDSAIVLSPLRPRAREFGQGALADRLPLELGQCREDAEHKALPAAVEVVSISAHFPVSTLRAHAAGRHVLQRC